MIDLFIAFMLGISFVGASAMRTLAMVDGNPMQTFLLSVFVGITYYFMVRYAMGEDLQQYIAFSVGTVLVTTYLAWRRKK